MYILVLEASTTSAKAMLYNTSNGTFEVETKRYEYDFDDVTVHNAEYMYQLMLAVGRTLTKDKKIDIISLGGTWHSLLLCDKNMVPTTPVYLWSYTGANEVCKELRKDEKYVKDFYKKTRYILFSNYYF